MTRGFVGGVHASERPPDGVSASVPPGFVRVRWRGPFAATVAGQAVKAGDEIVIPAEQAGAAWYEPVAGT